MIDQLREDVTKLALPHGRLIGTPGHAAARSYIVRRIHELALEPYAHGTYEFPYAAGEIKLINVLARLPGVRRSLPPVLVAAHYDTYGTIPGADDNASAIAIALAMVEPLRKKELHRDVIFAFFDAEEPPHFLKPSMGSIHYYEHQRDEPIHAAIVLDLVGHDVPIPGLADLLFVLGMESDEGMQTVIDHAMPENGLRIVAVPNAFIGDMSDHHVFRTHQRPYLFFSCGHWEHHHLHSDTPEKLNYPKMAHIASYMVDVITKVAEEPLVGPFEAYDSLPKELEYLRRHTMHLADKLKMPLDSRDDMRAFVETLVTKYGLLTER
ncbi:MAG TPA: M28 family peptidase [Candidatus Hydrogenedentes bacterium]|nr:M28 family peptidase [Candidatus Hydrogenedentota bacterium]HRK35212.1 M28 family peptidase [Candidatus Hydrogenedentota bacterium]